MEPALCPICPPQLETTTSLSSLMTSTSPAVLSRPRSLVNNCFSFVPTSVFTVCAYVLLLESEATCLSVQAFVSVYCVHMFLSFQCGISEFPCFLNLLQTLSFKTNFKIRGGGHIFRTVLCPKPLLLTSSHRWWINENISAQRRHSHRCLPEDHGDRSEQSDSHHQSTIWTRGALSAKETS